MSSYTKNDPLGPGILAVLLRELGAQQRTSIHPGGKHKSTPNATTLMEKVSWQCDTAEKQQRATLRVTRMTFGRGRPWAHILAPPEQGTWPPLNLNSISTTELNNTSRSVTIQMSNFTQCMHHRSWSVSGHHHHHQYSLLLGWKLFRKETKG